MTASMNDTRVTVRHLPWYGTSTSLADEQLTSAEALAQSGLDWTVDSRPLTYRARVDGKEKTFKSSKTAIVRTDTFDELGVVGGRYVPFQNQDAFAFLDKLVEDNGANFQAAGSLNNGSRVFVVMKLPETMKILGDEHDTYVLFITSHDGSMSVTATTTVVRLSCTNMFRAALSSERPVFKASHIAAHLTETEMVTAAATTLGVTKTDQAKFEELAKQLSDVRVNMENDVEFDKIMRQAMPWGSKATAKEIAGIRDLVVASPTIPDEFRNTGWGLINATTEYLGHYRTSRSEEAQLKRALGVNSQIESRLAKALLAKH